MLIESLVSLARETVIHLLHLIHFSLSAQFIPEASPQRQVVHITRAHLNFDDLINKKTETKARWMGEEIAVLVRNEAELAHRGEKLFLNLEVAKIFTNRS